MTTKRKEVSNTGFGNSGFNDSQVQQWRGLEITEENQVELSPKTTSSK
jgi:hypothetical protein